MRAFIFGVSLLWLACGYAEPPAQETAKDSAAPTTAASSIAAPTSAAPPAAKDPVAHKDDSSVSSLDQAFAKAAKKYRRMEKDGQQYYCRKETPLGSRLPKTVCVTEGQLKDSILAAQEERDSMILPNGAGCGSPEMPCH